jgi:hypothetical protein
MPSPTVSQLNVIKRLSRELGIDPPQPKGEREASYVIDDLVVRERKARRLRQRTLSFNAAVEATEQATGSHPPRG